MLRKAVASILVLGLILTLESFTGINAIGNPIEGASCLFNNGSTCGWSAVAGNHRLHWKHFRIGQTTRYKPDENYPYLVFGMFAETKPFRSAALRSVPIYSNSNYFCFSFWYRFNGWSEFDYPDVLEVHFMEVLPSSFQITQPGVSGIRKVGEFFAEPSHRNNWIYKQIDIQRQAPADPKSPIQLEVRMEGGAALLTHFSVDNFRVTDGLCETLLYVDNYSQYKGNCPYQYLFNIYGDRMGCRTCTKAECAYMCDTMNECNGFSWIQVVPEGYPYNLRCYLKSNSLQDCRPGQTVQDPLMQYDYFKKTKNLTETELNARGTLQ